MASRFLVAALSLPVVASQWWPTQGGSASRVSYATLPINMQSSGSVRHLLRQFTLQENGARYSAHFPRIYTYVRIPIYARLPAASTILIPAQG